MSALGNLVATTPEPFDRIAMTWENAYGGTAFQKTTVVRHEGEDAIVPEHTAGFALNVDGKGFYLSAEQALHQPLPSLEDPGIPISRWSDQPSPVCFAPCPLWAGLRAAHLIDTTDQKLDLSRMGRVTGRAAPGNVLRPLADGTRVEVHGMTHDRSRLSFLLPPAPVMFEVDVGGNKSMIVPLLDSVDVDAEGRRVRFVYRATVRAALVAFDSRDVICEPRASLETLRLRDPQ